MDIIERLTLEAARADTVLACEHRHRYEFAAALCAEQRVLDLCCGSGYGSELLAVEASSVVGVDNDAATVDTAQAVVAKRTPNVCFELADAAAYLHGDISERFDAVVCFEGLEHLHDLDRALSLLLGHAERGTRVIASVPNGQLFKDQNPFHITNFGYDAAVTAFSEFPATVLVPQFLAEGSLICPPDAEGTDVELNVEDRDEVAYANDFIFCVNFEPAALSAVTHGRLQLSTAPVYNRWSEGLKHAVAALERENARLARARLGKAGSAAATALVEHERERAGLLEEIHRRQARADAAQQRVRELEAKLAGRDREPVTELAPEASEPQAHIEPIALGRGPTSPQRTTPHGDSGSWAERRRRASDYLLPWIEQTISLAGKTVLEYGCGSAAVSCAVAQRAERLIGVDIDERAISQARENATREGVGNLELEFHPADRIQEAAAARRGEVDVFLLYAVLEHLTIAERLAVLRLALEVVRDDGAIVVCESPNRLVYFPPDTAQVPFFHFLPDELALEYHGRCGRGEFPAAIEGAVPGGHVAAVEAIARAGRGISFHEFEVVFDDLSRHVIASNYDPILFGERPVHPDEVTLSRYLLKWRPDLAPVWSRYRLDLILSPRSIDKRAPFIRPWTMETVDSYGVSLTARDTLRLDGPESKLVVELPHPTRRLVVASSAPGPRLSLEVQAETMADPIFETMVPTPGVAGYSSIQFAEPSGRITLSTSAPCEVHFVGYDD